LAPRTDPNRACPRCGSGLVYPELALDVGAARWRVHLRCPNCHWEQSRIFDEESMELLDRELDRGTAELACDLRAFSHVNMAESVERFIAALEADAILPMDF
jgi:hypothetical protein